MSCLKSSHIIEYKLEFDNLRSSEQVNQLEKKNRSYSCKISRVQIWSIFDEHLKALKSFVPLIKLYTKKKRNVYRKNYLAAIKFQCSRAKRISMGQQRWQNLAATNGLMPGMKGNCEIKSERKNRPRISSESYFAKLSFNFFGTSQIKETTTRYT